MDSDAAESVEKFLKITLNDGVEVAGVLTVPESSGSQKSAESRVVVLVHGYANDKNSSYQPELALELANEHGLYVFRFDTRVSGESNANFTLGKVETLEQYMEDFDGVFKYLIEVEKLALAGIVSHSHGTALVSAWLCRNQDRITVPTFINCAGLFFDPASIESRHLAMPSLRIDGGLIERRIEGGREKKSLDTTGSI